MESAKQEKTRSQTAATDAKKRSVELKEREHSRLRLETDGTTSHENRQKKQQQQAVPSRQCQDNHRKQQINEYRARLNQISHQKTQEKIRKYKQHLEAKHAREKE